MASRASHEGQPETRSGTLAKMTSSQDWGAKRAAGYDRRVRQLFPSYEELHVVAMAAIKQRVPPGARVLVIGAGTGKEAVELANSGYHVTAVDPSEDMLTIARERAEAAPNLEFFCGHLEEFQTDRSFEAAMSLLVMHFLPDDGSKERYLREAAKRSAPGAILVLADLTGEPGTSEFERTFAGWLAQLAENSTPAELERDSCRVKEDVHFVSVGRIGELLKAAGWKAAIPIWQAGWVAMWAAERR